MTVAEFIAKWKKADLKERSAAQELFIDLCHLVGHPTPAEADPTGVDFCFEKGAAKHGGGDGFADVWKRLFTEPRIVQHPHGLDIVASAHNRYTVFACHEGNALNQP